MTSNIPIVIVLAAAVASFGYLARLLTLSGAAAAALLGALVLGFGGWTWAILLLLFFMSSSLLSVAFRGRKQTANREYSKGSRRDAAQVAANGGLAALSVSLHFALGSPDWTWIAFAASLAAANADTWATELGTLSPARPRRITRMLEEVEPGTSGAVSPTGTLAALAGSATIAVAAALMSPGGPRPRIAAITLGGLAGSLVDSLLGATVQAIYYCERDHRETEKHPLHSCGAQTVLVRGWAWLNNDWVNGICTAAGAVFGCALGAAFGLF